MDINKLRELLPRVGTPSYIFDLDAFQKRAELVKKYFGDKIGLCFSIKANPFLLGRLPEVFDKIDPVPSEGMHHMGEGSDLTAAVRNKTRPVGAENFSIAVRDRKLMYVCWSSGAYSQIYPKPQRE